ncbi:MAG: hypothetical protein ACPGJS_13965 [Flammeovirgaceae bacterium]
MNKTLCMCILCLLSLGSLKGQQLFQSEESFFDDAKQHLFTSANRTGIEQVWGAFEQVYEGKLNAAQKHQVFVITQRMFDKKYLPSPHFENFYACVAYGMENDLIGQAQMNNFLAIADTVLKIYKGKVYSDFLKHTRSIVEYNQLYRSRYNSCQLLAGKLTFGHAIDDKNLDTLYTFEDAGLHLEEELVEAEDDAVDSWAKALEDADREVDTIGSMEWGEGLGARELIEEELKAVKSAFEREGYEKGMLLDGDSAKLFVASAMPKPTVKGPFVDLQHATILLTAPSDSLQIKGTHGQLMLHNLHFVGNNGRVDWRSVGLDSQQVYCDLSSYSFHLDKPEFIAEAAHLTYQPRLKVPITGILVYKIDKAHRDAPQYPSFTSYFNDIELDDIAPGVFYKGGFTLRGKRIHSTSLSGGKSSISVKTQDTLRFKAISRSEFSFVDSSIVSESANLIVYHNQKRDSVEHPAIQLRYDAAKHLLKARKDKSTFKYSPFKSTYHNIEVTGDYLEWDLESDSLAITILNARNKIPLEIESEDYFDYERFARLTGLHKFNPLQMVVYFARQEKKGNTFTSASLAEKHRISKEVIKGSMNNLAVLGYIRYDPITDEVTLLRKAILYYYANKRKIDYDNINIRSISPSKRNAILRTKSNEMLVRGVKSFTLSDSMKVQVAPAQQEIIIKENRTTEFSGKMRSGSFIYKGDDFTFNYDSFYVNMPQIDEVGILLKDTITGRDIELPNGLVGTKGKLLISRPNNKSGLKKQPGYPKFSTVEASAIYFGGEEILDGAYAADTSIVFEIPPFELDSLNSSDPNTIAFEGKFRSGGIFPDFEERASIMPDKSLGFVTNAPDTGYVIYPHKLKEKAKFYNQISLDNRGIRGDGKMEYLTGSFLGDDYIFFSDSVVTGKPGTSGEIKPGEYKGVSYPNVKMEKYKMRWLVNKDSMLLSSIDQDFEIYNSEVAFKGELALTPKALNGKGNFETDKSKTFSDQFVFREHDYGASNATFLVKSANPEKPAMKGENISVHYDFKGNFADMRSEKSGDQTLVFPFAQYATNLEKAHWDFEKQIIEISVGDTSQLTTSKFVSTNPAQEGLEFSANKAIYDLRDNTINAEGVPFIKVANVLIKPDGGKLQVSENAEMQELENATIVLNAFTKYHTLTEGHIKIKSRKSFDGRALYTYLNDSKDTIPILFEHFDVKIEREKRGRKVAEKFTTTAQAEIREDERFPIFSGMLYKGDVNLIDYKKYLEFDGVIAPDLPREKQWFKYVSVDTSTYGRILIDENTKIAGTVNKLQSGLFLTKNTPSLYGSFLAYQREKGDVQSVFTAKGLLTFNESAGEYTISPESMRNGKSYRGNHMVYNHDKQVMSFEGPLTLLKGNKDVAVHAAGVGVAKLDKQQYKMNTMILLEFEPNTQAFDAMSEVLIEGADDKGIYYNQRELYSNFSEFVSQPNFIRFQKDYEGGVKSFSKYLDKYLTLSKVTLNWSEEHQAFYNADPEVGLANVFKNDVDVTLKGYIEIPKTEDNSTIHIYLENEVGDWYYISFKGNNVRVYASADEFNGLLLGKKEKIELAEVDEAEEFKRTFLQKYLGIERSDLEIPIKKDDALKKEEEADEKKDGF